MKIKLRQMSDEEFKRYLPTNMDDYARSRVMTDFETLEEAKKNSQAQLDELLPQGMETHGHHFFCICDQEGRNVGYAWLKVDSKKRIAWLYDIVIQSERRRKGYGRYAMQELMSKAKELGARVFWLNVMGHNQPAQKLYQSLGMNTAAIHMNMLLE